MTHDIYAIPSYSKILNEDIPANVPLKWKNGKFLYNISANGVLIIKLTIKITTVPIKSTKLRKNPSCHPLTNPINNINIINISTKILILSHPSIIIIYIYLNIVIFMLKYV
jgi:hypothetical protein